MKFKIEICLENKGSISFKKDFEDADRAHRFLKNLCRQSADKVVFKVGDEYFMISMSRVVAIICNPIEEE